VVVKKSKGALGEGDTRKDRQHERCKNFHGREVGAWKSDTIISEKSYKTGKFLLPKNYLIDPLSPQSSRRWRQNPVLLPVFFYF
jgi:hypothetical protein